MTGGRDRPHSDRVALGFVAVGAGFAVVAIASYLVFGAWYSDDACPRAQWQCDTALFGLIVAIVTAPLAGLGLLIGFLVWWLGPWLSGWTRGGRRPPT